VPPCNARRRPIPSPLIDPEPEGLSQTDETAQVVADKVALHAADSGRTIRSHRAEQKDLLPLKRSRISPANSGHDFANSLQRMSGP